MTFDYCISNPAFNIAELGNAAGTGGNTTLYKTATRNDFDNRLKENGQLINITLKGIIPDLVSGYFKDYQVDFIHLMDNIDVWPYNTCFFLITKRPRTGPPVITGGLAAKIYSPYPSDCFPFVYYSGSNNGMNHLFSPGARYQVIRRLPGRNRPGLQYDYTDRKIPPGWKFAFTVLESKKSYTITDEPIYGGTICYIPTNNREEAEKLKLFVEKNKIFAEYVRRMNIKGHAFGLRNVRKFNLSQIITGEEIPIEWKITEQDLRPPQIFTNEFVENRERVKSLGEVFTPSQLVDFVLNSIPAEDFHSRTFIDSMCGNGQFLVGLKNRGVPSSNIYGIDLTPENIDTAIQRINGCRNNIVCCDSFSNKFTRNEVLENLFEHNPNHSITGD